MDWPTQNLGKPAGLVMLILHGTGVICCFNRLLNQACCRLTRFAAPKHLLLQTEIKIRGKHLAVGMLDCLSQSRHAESNFGSPLVGGPVFGRYTQDYISAIPRFLLGPRVNSNDASRILLVPSTSNLGDCSRGWVGGGQGQMSKTLPGEGAVFDIAARR